MIYYASITAFLALCAMAVCKEPGDKPTIFDLQVSKYAALGSAVPHLVEHRGQLYSFWRGHAGKETKHIKGLPVIPAGQMRGSWKAGWNTVVYASRLEAGKWSAAVSLVHGDVQCDPKFVWSDPQGLHMLVDLGDDTCSHLLLSDKQKLWKQIRHFPELKEGIFVPLGIKQVGESLHVTTFSRKQLCYWRYDGRNWHGPVVIEEEVKFDGTYGYFKPRLAVVDSGEVHVVWNTQTDPSHVVIRDDKVVLRQFIRLTPRASKGDEIDIEALPNGKLMLAYQVTGEDANRKKQAIYICRFEKGRWAEAHAGPAGGGMVFGGAQLAAHKDQVLLVWRHQGKGGRRGMMAMGPTASFSVYHQDGAWTEPQIIKPISPDPVAGIGGGPTFYSLYCKRDGSTYMTWGDRSVYVTKLHQLGVKPK